MTTTAAPSTRIYKPATRSSGWQLVALAMIAAGVYVYTTQLAVTGLTVTADTVVAVAKAGLGTTIESQINDTLGEFRARPESLLSVLEYRGEQTATEARTLRTVLDIPVGSASASVTWEFISHAQIELASADVFDLGCSESGDVCTWRVPPPTFSRAAVITDTIRLESGRSLLIFPALETELRDAAVRQMTSRTQRRLESPEFWGTQRAAVRERLAAWATEHLLQSLPANSPLPLIRVVFASESVFASRQHPSRAPPSAGEQLASERELSARHGRGGP